MNIKYTDIIILLFIIFCCIPHYDEDSSIVLIGIFYSKKKSKFYSDLLNFNKILKQKNKSLEQSNNSLNLTIKKIYNQHTQCLDELEKIKNNKQELSFKLEQKENFIKSQEKIRKNNNNKKKEGFSRVSKKNINNKRPEIGNIYSKSLKKSLN